MEKKVENLRKQMGIPDPKEAKNEKKRRRDANTRRQRSSQQRG